MSKDAFRYVRAQLECHDRSTSRRARLFLTRQSTAAFDPAIATATRLTTRLTMHDDVANSYEDRSAADAQTTAAVTVATRP